MAKDYQIKFSSNKIFFVGIALSSSANYDSAIAVLNSEKKIISLDKFYINDDFQTFFKNYMSLKDTVFCVSIPIDNTLLEGKWRIHTKNYQMVSNDFEINKNNWTNRNSTRLCDVISKYKQEGTDIFRYDISQIRSAYNLSPTYIERSSLDCKNFHSALKMKFNFRELPENMLPASNMEALLGAMFAFDIAHGAKTQLAYTFEGTEVLLKV